MTEPELAQAAASLLARTKDADGKRTTQTAAAALIGVTPHVVSMALALEPDPEAGDADGRPYKLRYPTRGHRTRRAILRRFGGLVFDGDDPNVPPHSDAERFDADGPTHSRVNRNDGPPSG